MDRGRAQGMTTPASTFPRNWWRGEVENVGLDEGHAWFVDGTDQPIAERDLRDVRHEVAAQAVEVYSYQARATGTRGSQGGRS